MNKLEIITLVGFALIIVFTYILGSYTGYVRGYNEAYDVCIFPIETPYYEFYVNLSDNTTLYHENGNYNGSYGVLNG